MSEDAGAAYEPVHTVTDWYDGPRGGLADLDGQPHVYRSSWADAHDEDPDVLELWPVDADTLRLALEAWAIWMRWSKAFHAGQTTRETHPALPADRARHDELETILAVRLARPAGAVIRVHADFRARPTDPDVLEVRWTRLDPR